MSAQTALQAALRARMDEETKDNPELEQGIGEVLSGLTEYEREFDRVLDYLVAGKRGTREETKALVMRSKADFTRMEARLKGVFETLYSLPLSDELGELWDKEIDAFLARFRIDGAQEPATAKPPAAPAIPFTHGPDWHGKVEVLDNAAVAFAMMGLAAGGRHCQLIPNGWEANPFDETNLSFNKPNWRHGGDWRISIDAATGDASELWATVARYGTLHMQVFFFILAKMGEPRNKAYYPLLETVTVEIEKVLDDKGIKRRGKDRDNLRQQVAQCVKDLSQIRMTVRNANLHGQSVALKNVALFEVAEVYSEQLCLSWEEFDRQCVDKQPIGWAVRAGMWANPFFKDNKTRGFVTETAKLYLELDYRNDRLSDLVAFRIGILLLDISADGTDNRKREKQYTVAALLQALYLFLEEKDRAKNWANRIETALTDALDKLQANGRLVSYRFGATYPEVGSRGRGWVPEWLSAEIILVTPTAAEALSLPARPVVKKKPTVKRRRGPAQPQEHLDAATIAAIRAKLATLNASRAWKQKTLAAHLKVSEAYMTYLLKGERAPKAELAERLQDWLKNYPED